MKSYTLVEIEKKYGITRYAVAALVKEGFVTPERGKRREYRFSFCDIVVLKMAADLLASGLSNRKIMRFVKQLRQKLPEDIPLQGLRISAAGHELVVRQGRSLVNATGQQVIDFHAVAPGATIGSISFLASDHRHAGDAAQDWYRRAVSLEVVDPFQSVQCYRRAVEVKPGYAEAWLNLGCLLIEGEQYLEAYAAHQEALVYCPASPMLCFNFGIVCEELKRLDEALTYYKKAIHFDPAFADAHYNIARLHEILGHHTSAVRHYSEYRRLGG